MFKAILAASAITLAAVATASAAPMSPATAAINADGLSVVIDVQKGERSRNRHRHRSHRHRDRRHHAQRHHNRYHGWHRYSARPWNWQRRGCVALGPVWVCP